MILELTVKTPQTINAICPASTYRQEVTRGTDIVEVGGYLPIITTGGALVGSSNLSNRSFLYNNNYSKIRINGTINKISFFIVSVDPLAFNGITEWWLQIWRKIGSTYYLIHEEDIRNKINYASTNEVNLNGDIDVLEGDRIGFAIIKTTGLNLFRCHTGVDNSLRYVDNTAKQTTGFSWETQQSGATILPIKVYGQSSLIVAIGDSIMAGHSGHYTYLENSMIDVKVNSITYQLSILDDKYIYQNMSVGGNTSGQVLLRFTNDCINLKPKIALMNMGVNDIGNGISKVTFFNNWTTILNACQSSGIIPVVCKINPWTNGTTEQMRIKENWMPELKVLVNSYVGSVWVDCDAILGKFRTGGDEGNLWDLKTEYDLDGVHCTLAGYVEMAKEINRKIKQKYTFV